MSIELWDGKFLYKKKLYNNLEEATHNALANSEVNSFALFVMAKISQNPAYREEEADKKQIDYDAFSKSREALARAVRSYQADAKKQAAENNIFNRLDVLSSAKIAKKVVSTFQPEKEVADVIDYFKSVTELREALEVSHARLRNEYIEAIKQWFESELDISEEDFENDLRWKDEFGTTLDNCMNQGLSAIMKSDPFYKILSEGGLDLSSPEIVPPNAAAPNKIEKKRKWKDILRDRD